MKRKLLKRLEYEKPEVSIIPLLEEGFICSSVVPKSPADANSEEDWIDDPEKDMGDFEI